MSNKFYQTSITTKTLIKDAKVPLQIINSNANYCVIESIIAEIEKHLQQIKNVVHFTKHDAKNYLVCMIFAKDIRHKTCLNCVAKRCTISSEFHCEKIIISDDTY